MSYPRGMGFRPKSIETLERSRAISSDLERTRARTCCYARSSCRGDVARNSPRNLILEPAMRFRNEYRDSHPTSTKVQFGSKKILARHCAQTGLDFYLNVYVEPAVAAVLSRIRYRAEDGAADLIDFGSFSPSCFRFFF